ncbi:hypothetical protein GCK72_024987 [Caenorhabditis remanei]|uniref:WD repeat-containing protein 89 n=1 Tax=Caenorhabditis remanei TaxID=31234 RepID=E3MRN5_CAERE|nr:hypothetical protein GCK72_024987 [Caenorhabditis remanei]EFP08046.1 hypothetical protein CRE_14780 [Caenorhabditis remanei]KAF1748520.1 hypothetical protein GCK72_024987 [Caenorhabditis remanei]
MPVRIDLSSTSSVRMIAVNEDNLACAYLANLYIPIFTLDTGSRVRRYEVSNQLAGIHFSHNKKSVIYAVDDSFGLHLFDVRSDSKKKFRLNPESENHNVNCTAMANEIIAVASSEFGGGILDVRGSRRREHHAHVISLYDVRYPTDPITSYYKRHKAGVVDMQFYLNGTHLITGDTDGSLKSFDTKLRDEDNAIRWERWVKGPITKVGVINKRIVYGISDRSEATVFVDAKGSLEVLYGSVNTAANEPILNTSKAFFKKPEWCAGLIKGVTDEIPLVAVHGVEKKKFISLTAMNQEGVRQSTPMLTYKGHTGDVKCMTVTPELLITGGEDGKVVVQISNFKNPKFGEDNTHQHHRLTLNRGDLAELEDNGEGRVEEVSDDSDSDSDSKAPGSSSKPSTSKSSSKPSSSSAGASSSSAGPSTSGPSSSSKSKSSKPDKEKEKEKEKEKKEKKERKEKEKEEEKEKERKKKKEEKERKKKQEEEEAEKEKKAKTEEKEKKEERARKEEKEKRKKEEQEKKEKKAKDDQPSTSAASAPSSSSSKQETKEERKARKEREAKARELAEKKKSEPMTEEQKKYAEEREARRLAKLAETPEQRAARKQKAREERERLEKLEKEAKKAKKRDGEGSSSSDPKRAKH